MTRHDTRSPNPSAATDSAETKSLRIETPWLVLGALLLSTCVASFQSYRQVNKETQSRFETLAETAKNELSTQFRQVDDALSTAGAIVAASPKIDNARWNKYLDSRDKQATAVTGLARIEYRAAVDPIRKAARADPPPVLIRVTPEVTVVSDTLAGSELITAAIETSRRTQRTAATGVLPAASPQEPAEFIALAKPVFPVFTELSEPIGYLVAFVRPADLLAGMTRRSNQRLFFTLRDQAEGPAAAASSNNGARQPAITTSSIHKSAYRVPLTLAIGQRNWQLQVESSPSLERELTNSTPGMILGIGIVGTFLLAGLVLCYFLSFLVQLLY